MINASHYKSVQEGKREVKAPFYYRAMLRNHSFCALITCENCLLLFSRFNAQNVEKI